MSFIVFLQSTSTGISALGALAGAIPVIGGVVSGLINNSNQDAINASNQAFQESQQQQMEAYNTAQWNAQNAYNSPEEVMQRYESAGLNPNLIYGGGSGTGNLAMMPQPAPRVEFVAQAHPNFDLGTAAAQSVQAYNQTVSTAAQSNLVKQQSINVAQDTALKAAQEINVNADTGLKDNQEAGQAISNLYSGDALRASIAQMKANASLVLTQQQTAQLMQQPNLVTALQNVANMKENNLLTQAQIDNINANIAETKTRTQLDNLNIYLQNHGLNLDSSLMSRLSSIVLQNLSRASVGAKMESADQAPDVIEY